MNWWTWILLGVVLAAIELATPGGFVFLFFAIAAVVLGVLEALGVLTSDALQWGLFSVLSLASLAFFRRPLQQWMAPQRGDSVDSLVGELAVPAIQIAAGEHGRAELRGSIWNVRNVHEAAVAAGERCRVVAVRGLELDIRPERVY